MVEHPTFNGAVEGSNPSLPTILLEKEVRSVLEISSSEEDTWTKEEKERFDSFDNKLNDLLKQAEELLEKQNEKKFQAKLNEDLKNTELLMSGMF